MGFQNEITGGQGALERPAIKSPNYMAGAAGWSIKRDGSAEFNNIVIRGGQTVGGTALYYSGTPAAGNLIASIAAAAGTDAYGNAYPAGVATYDSGGRTTVLQDGTLFLGTNGAASQAGNAYVINTSQSPFNALELNSGYDTPGDPDASRLTLWPGASATATGTVSTPIAQLLDMGNGSDVDFQLSGTIIKTNNTGTPYTWTAPTSFGTGWAQGTGIGGNYPNLMWRYDAENNVHIHGTFHATAANPQRQIASGFPPPHLYHGAGNVGIVGGAYYVSGDTYVMPLYLDTSGNLWATADTNLTDTTATFIVNAKVPLGQIQ